MSHVFKPSRSGRGAFIPVLGALGLTALMFLIMPLTQMLSSHYKVRENFIRVDMALPPPPPPPPEPPPPEEEEEQEEKPEMEQERKPLSLSQLEFAMNPGFGGTAGLAAGLGAFDQAPDVDVAKEILVFEVGETDSNASLTFYPDVQYPPSLRRERIVGRGKITFVVYEDGSVGEIEKLENVSHPDFIEVFMKWVKQWRFEPAKKDGRPVRQRWRAPLTINP